MSLDPQLLERLRRDQATSTDYEGLARYLAADTDDLGRLEPEPLRRLVALVRDCASTPLPLLDEGQVRLLERLKQLVPPQTEDAPTTAYPAPADLSFLASAQQPNELGRLGKYRVLELRGRGGMGLVFRAEDSKLRRQVALKVMLPDIAQAQTGRQRFLREARSAAALKHPHIVTVYEADEVGEVAYLAMEWIEGESLAERLRRDGRVPLAEVLRIGQECAAGLEAAHNQGLIHRDVKPGNILLEQPTGTVRLIDFGLTRSAADSTPGLEDEPLTTTNQRLGTPAYMAPEQALGDAERIDRRCDLYSLGAVLYEMCAGKRPFQNQRAALLDRPRPPRELNPDVPPELSDLILRLLSWEAAERPASASAVRAALESLASAGTAETQARSATAAPASARRTAQRWPWVAAATGVLLIGLAFVLFHVWPFWETESPKRTDLPALQPPPKKTLQSPPEPLRGDLDIRVTEKGNPRRQRLMLHQEWALPLRPGDVFEYSVKLNRPAYLYAVYLNSDGTVASLDPWLDLNWRRPPMDAPRDHLDLTGGMSPGPSGIEAVLLLVRETPLPVEVTLPEVIGSLPPQNNLSNPTARAWFENGKLQPDGGGVRAAPQLWRDNPNDPIPRTQALIRERLQKLFPYTRAVCFAFEGKP